MDATGGVWALLAVAGLVVLALIGLAVLAERPATTPAGPEALRAEADELVAHAAAVREHAERAAEIAGQDGEAAAVAERQRDEAWAALEAVERAYAAAWRAVLAGRETAGVIPEITDAVEPERRVSRAALSAYRRGDISVQELRAVWRRVGAWVPEQKERERVAEHHRLERLTAQRVYDEAAAVLHDAQERAQVAEVAAQALIDEAVEAALDAHEALLAVARHAPRRRRLRWVRRAGRIVLPLSKLPDSVFE